MRRCSGRRRIRRRRRGSRIVRAYWAAKCGQRPRHARFDVGSALQCRARRGLSRKRLKQQSREPGPFRRVRLPLRRQREFSFGSARPPGRRGEVCVDHPRNPSMIRADASQVLSKPRVGSGMVVNTEFRPMHGLIHPLWVIAATSAINNEPQIIANVFIAL
jgi:hypothetical protein